MLNELSTTTNLVKSILEKDEQARNSDSFLYLKVLEHIAERKGVALYYLPVPMFLNHMKEFGFPIFETVRRTRQKLQAAYPELAACDKVAEMRSANEVDYYQYAKGDLNA